MVLELRCTCACTAPPACLPACCLQVLDQVGDEAAVYSPLARGASLLSDRGYRDGAGGGGGATPRSLASNGPLVSDGGATPRSPWCACKAPIVLNV